MTVTKINDIYIKAAAAATLLNHMHSRAATYLQAHTERSFKRLLNSSIYWLTRKNETANTILHVAEY